MKAFQFCRTFSAAVFGLIFVIPFSSAQAQESTHDRIQCQLIEYGKDEVIYLRASGEAELAASSNPNVSATTGTVTLRYKRLTVQGSVEFYEPGVFDSPGFVYFDVKLTNAKKKTTARANSSAAYREENGGVSSASADLIELKSKNREFVYSASCYLFR